VALILKNLGLFQISVREQSKIVRKTLREGTIRSGGQRPEMRAERFLFFAL